MEINSKEYQKKYYQKNKERRKEYLSRPDINKRKKEYYKKYYQKNKEYLKQKRKIYCQENKKTLKMKMKTYYSKNIEKIKKHREKWYEENKRKVLQASEKWRKHNLKKVNLYQKNKRNYNNNYYISVLLRNRLRKAFKLYSTTGKQHTSKKYGIDFAGIIEHLKPFPKDIVNYEIDHIIPLSRFDFNNQKHIKIAFSPENHQWLTIKENRSKGNKLIMPHVYN